MNVVPARRQLQAELGRHNSASPVGGITRDSDFHVIVAS
jgi:hypothetical protein